LIAQNTAVDINTIVKTPGCSYYILSADENNSELRSQNQNDSTILKSNIDLNDSDDDNLCGFDIVNSIDSTGKIDEQLPCTVQDL